MNRITERQLQIQIDRINFLTRSPINSWSRNEDGTLFSYEGNYHLSHAYGGVCLHRMVNDCGAVQDVFSCGHVPKRDLYNRIRAFITGLESK